MKLNTSKTETIVITNDILNFYGGAEVETTAVGDFLAYRPTSTTVTTPVYSHYVVDPIYIAPNRTKILVGTPKADGSNPKINASIYVAANATLIVQNLDIVPDIAICANFNLTAAASNVVKASETSNFGVLSGTAAFLKEGDEISPSGFRCGAAAEYAGVYVAKGGTLEMYDSSVDVQSSVAPLNRTVSSTTLRAQAAYSNDWDSLWETTTTIAKEGQTDPLYAVFAVADPDTFAYFDETEVKNKGRYGVFVSRPDNIQIFGGDFDAAGYPLVFNLGQTGTLDLDKVVADLDDEDNPLILNDYLAKNPQKLSAITIPAYTLQDPTGVDGVDMSWLDEFSVFANVLLNTNRSSTGDNQWKVMLSDISSGSGIEADFGIVMADIQIPEDSKTSTERADIGTTSWFTRAGTLADEFDANPDEFKATYPTLMKAAREYVKFRALQENLEWGAFGGNLKAAIKADAEEFIAEAIDERIKRIAKNAVDELLSENALAENAENEARRLVNEVIFKVPELAKEAVVNYSYYYNYTYDYDYTQNGFDFDYTYSGTIAGYKYENPFYRFYALKPGDPEFVELTNVAFKNTVAKQNSLDSKWVGTAVEDAMEGTDPDDQTVPKNLEMDTDELAEWLDE